MRHHRQEALRLTSALLTLAVYSATPAIGDEAHWWAFQPTTYFDPIRAEARSANVRVTFPAISEAFPFSQSSGRRLVWDITMGREIPLFGYGNYDVQADARPDPGSIGLGLWLPIGFHMIEDLKDPSGPILNVDYRFGGMAKFDYAATKTDHVTIRLLGAHESTHVGDEFVIAARRLFPEFERINVSNEFWDAAIGWDHDVEPETRRDGFSSARCRIVAGLWWLWNPDDGLYSSDTTETNGRMVPASSRSVEPYFAFEYEFGLHLPSFLEHWSPFFSAEARSRIVYDYYRADSSDDEDTQWSVNALLGIFKDERDPKTKGTLEFFCRFYYGVNPHGQFRSQRNYTLFGLGFQMGY